MNFLAAFSPDSTRVLTATNDGTARSLDGRRRRGISPARQPWRLHLDAGWNEDGSLVFTAGIDRTARVWSPTTGDVVAYLRGHTDTVNSAAFSPDGRTVATGGADAEVRLWDIGPPVVMGGHGQFEPPLTNWMSC